MSSSVATLATRVSPRIRSTISITGSIPPGVYLAATVIAFFLLSALAPQLLQTHSAFKMDLRATLQPPSLSHPFGTDQAGRDLYSRIVNGSGQSLAIGLGATALSMTIALALGFAAGLGGRIVDGAISRIPRCAVRVSDAVSGAALCRGVRSIGADADYRGGTGDGPWLRSHGPRPGSGGAGGWLCRGGHSARTSIPAHRLATHLPQCSASACRDDDVGGRAGHRVGVGSRFPRPWSASALAGMGRIA